MTRRIRDVVEKVAQGIDDFMHLKGTKHVPTEHSVHTGALFQPIEPSEDLVQDGRMIALNLLAIWAIVTIVVMVT